MESWWDHEKEPWDRPRRKPSLWSLLEREFGPLSPAERKRFNRAFAVLLSGESERTRALNQGMAEGGLQMLKRAEALGWQEGDPFPALRLPTATDRWGREEFKLRYWELAKRMTERDETGRGTTLALTPAGVNFFRGRLLVQRDAVLLVRYVIGHPEFRVSEKFIRLEGPPWSVHDALGPDSAFDLRDLSA